MRAGGPSMGRQSASRWGSRGGRARRGRERWIYLAELAPRPGYFRAAPEKFDRMFRAQMDRLAADILAKLTWITDEYGPCSLLCFERRVRPGPQDCHRRIAAEFIENRLGIEVRELDPR